MKLNFRKLGNGNKPVVILHGLFGSADNWLTIAKKFSEKYSIYLVDLRNHGLSPHSEIHNYQSMSEDLYEFILDHNLKDIVLIGHSMGGKVAIDFSIGKPDFVDKLIIVDIAPKMYKHDNKDKIEAMLSVNLNQIKSRDEVEKLLENKIPDKITRLFLLKNLYRKDDLSFGWRLNLNSLNENIKSIEGFVTDKTYSKDTLFLQGENSTYLKDEDYPLIKEIFPNALIIKIPGAGHWLHSEKPDLTFQAINNFIK